MSRWKLKAFIIVANALWTSTTLAANGVMPTDGARRLVRTMKLGDVAILAAQVGLAHDSSSGAQNVVLLNCVRRIKAEALVDDLAPELDAALTPKEIEDAEEFFSQAAGQKIIDLGLRDLHRRIEKKSESPVRQTRDEAREIEAFAKTSAGEKLLVKEVLSRSTFSEKARAHMREIVNQCVQGETRTD